MEIIKNLSNLDQTLNWANCFEKMLANHQTILQLLPFGSAQNFYLCQDQLRRSALQLHRQPTLAADDI